MPHVLSLTAEERRTQEKGITGLEDLESEVFFADSLYVNPDVEFSVGLEDWWPEFTVDEDL